MSTIVEKKQMDSDDRAMLWVVVSVVAGIVALVTAVLLCVSVLSAVHRPERITNNISLRTEYIAAVKACDHAIPSNVTLCVASVNQNFVTAG